MTAPPAHDSSRLLGQVVAGTTASVAGAVVGAHLGPDAGSAVAAALTPVMERVARLDQRSWDNVGTVLNATLDRAAVDADTLASWSDGSPERLRLLGHVVEAALHSMHDARIPALARVLADAYEDDAKLDTAPLIVSALRELEPAHVRVLSSLTSPSQTTLEGQAATWSIENLKLRHPNLAVGMEPILATLDRVGAIYASAGFGGPFIWEITDFGRLCLDHLGHGKEGSADA